MVANWFTSNHLTLNIKKTKLMMFGTWQALSKFKDISLTYDNNDIEIVDKFTYLGFVFDPHLSWSEHVNHMSSNISKRIGVIRRIRYYLPCSTVNLLAKAMVFPLFDYCSPVWSNFTANHHNHLQILKKKTCSRSQCSNTLIVPLWNISAGKRTFQYRAATLWNRLPVDVRSKFTDMSLNEFKSVI